MELSVELVCPCNGMRYKTKATLATHKKSKMHLAWEKEKEQRQDKCRSKEFENEIHRLQNKLAQRERTEACLLKRIDELEKERDEWKEAYELTKSISCDRRSIQDTA